MSRGEGGRFRWCEHILLTVIGLLPISLVRSKEIGERKRAEWLHPYVPCRLSLSPVPGESEKHRYCKLCVSAWESHAET